MKKLAVLLLGAIVVIGLMAQGSTVRGAGQKILAFDTMVPVTAPFLNPNNPIRGVNGGGLPWAINQGEGELATNGDLEVKVRGLVVADTGTNPSTTFRAIVSCQTTAPAIVNVTTAAFPATPAGDADIEETLTLPSPCLAPIIFVTNSAGTRWFAITGN